MDKWTINCADCSHYNGGCAIVSQCNDLDLFTHKDAKVRSCLAYLMASTWEARNGTRSERWQHAERMHREHQADIARCVALAGGK